MRIFQGAKHPFPGYMMCMLDKDCQDPRDRFFSTLSLVDWQRFGQAQPVPDYRITPLELAFDLLQITATPSLYDISYISESMGLQYSPQVLSDMKGNVHRESHDTPLEDSTIYGFLAFRLFTGAPTGNSASIYIATTRDTLTRFHLISTDPNMTHRLWLRTT